MELFIWSRSSGANHWIKTRSRVTRGFDLSLRLSDTHRPLPTSHIPPALPYLLIYTHTSPRAANGSPAAGVFSSRVLVSHWAPRPPARCDGEGVSSRPEMTLTNYNMSAHLSASAQFTCASTPQFVFPRRLPQLRPDVSRISLGSG